MENNRGAELTAKLVEVCLNFPPGVEEHSALLCADGDHTVLVYGDARHLSVELRHRHALQNKGWLTHELIKKQRLGMSTRNMRFINAVELITYSYLSINMFQGGFKLIFYKQLIVLKPLSESSEWNDTVRRLIWGVPLSREQTPGWWGSPVWLTPEGLVARRGSSFWCHHMPASSSEPCLCRDQINTVQTGNHIQNPHVRMHTSCSDLHSQQFLLTASDLT